MLLLRFIDLDIMLSASFFSLDDPIKKKEHFFFLSKILIKSTKLDFLHVLWISVELEPTTIHGLGYLLYFFFICLFVDSVAFNLGYTESKKILLIFKNSKDFSIGKDL